MQLLWLDTKYCNLLSFRLEKFKRKDKSLYNFRCPYCGDSKRDKTKARGYIFEHKGTLKFKCHNCNVSRAFQFFLKDISPDLYEQYTVEKIKENKFQQPEKFVRQIESFGLRRMDKFEPLQDLKKISQLDSNHPAKLYCIKRKIPFKEHFRLYYTPKFYTWANKHLPGKFKEDLLQYDEPRLVIPFIDSKGYVFACTGRAFSNKSVRYITVKFDDSHPKIFGLDQIDFTKKAYIFEGPIDSLFIPNSLAFAGSAGDLKGLPITEDSCVCMDNEPRNKDIVNRMLQLVEEGYSVCVWPPDIEYKDINEMIVAGYSQEQIKTIIDSNQYSGLKAKLAISNWKKY